MSQDKKPSRSLLTSCLVVTVVLHLAFVTYLFRHPLFFQPSFTAAWTKGMTTDMADVALSKKKKSLFLQQALSQIAIIAPRKKTTREEIAAPLDSEKRAMPHKNFSNCLVNYTLDPAMQLPVAINETFTSSVSINLPKEKGAIVTSPLSFQHPKLPEKLLSHSLTIDTSLLFIEKQDHAALAPVSAEEKRETPEAVGEPLKTSVADNVSYLVTGYDERQNSFFAEKMELEKLSKLSNLMTTNAACALLSNNPLIIQRALPSIESYLPDGPALAFSDWSDYFHLDYVFLPHEEKGEYRFALTLTPKDDLSTIQMKQNFYFLIDNSNSIEKHRFTGFKRAVLRALSVLGPDQTFNICIFDRKTSRLSKESLSPTRKNLQLAKQFLESRSSSDDLSANELYSTLPKLMPQNPASNEMHIALLISDGNSSLTTQKQKDALKKFLKNNQEKIALYAATCGRGNDLSGLKVLTTQAGGDLLFSPTHAAFARKLAKFVLELRSPLAKSVIASVSSSDRTIKTKLLTPSSHLPGLFNHTPFTLYGATSDPTTLTITLQGIHKDQPIVIQKEITFERPLAKSPQLEKAWLEQLAWNHWGKYIKSGKKEDLKRAKSCEEEAASVQLRRVSHI